MADQIVVTEVIIDSRGAKEGSAEYVTAMNAIARVQQNMQGTFDRTIEKMRALAEAGSNGAMVMTNGAQSISRTAREYDKLLASINPTTAALKKAEEQYQRTMNVVSQNMQLGRPIEEANKVIADATRNLKLMQDTAKGIEIQGPMRQTAAEIKQVAEAASKAEHELRAAASAAEALASRGSRYKANVDPQFAAQERYNASVAEAKSLLEQGAIGANHYAAGIAKADAELKQATADNSGLTASLKQAAAAFKEVEKASRDAAAAAKVDAAKKLAEATKQAAEEQIKFQRALDETNPEQANDRRRNERMKEYTAYLKEGKFTQEEFNNAQAFANRQHELTRRSIEGTNVAMGKYAKGTGLARHEMINFGRQAQDVFVSLASGQGVMTVLIQQGTQIFDIFATSKGSFGGFLSQIVPTIVRALPIVTALTAAAGALYAAFNVSSERQSLSNSLLGAGRSSGLGAGDLNEIANQSAVAADITVSNSRRIAAEYVKLGAVASTNLPKLTQLTKDYAAVTGQAMPDAAKELASALADPAKGAENLGQKLGTLDSTTTRMIRTALDLNDKLRAQKLLMDELARAAAGAADASLSKWERLTNQMGLVAGKIKEAAAAPFVADTANEALDRQRALVKRLEDRIAQGGGTGARPGRDKELADAQATLATLLAQKAAKDQITQVNQKIEQGNSKINDGERIAASTGIAGLAQRMKAMNEQLGVVRGLEASLAELTNRRNAIGVPDSSNRQEFATITAQIKEQTEALDAQKKKLSEVQTSTAGMTIEQERAARLRDVDIKASNDKTMADAKQTAEMREQAKAYGEAVGPAEMAKRVKEAQRDVAAKGTIAVNEENKAIRNNIAAQIAAGEAAKEGGKAAADAAEMRARGAQQASERGVDNSQDQLNQKIAEQKRLVAELVFQRKEEASAINTANAAALRGDMSATQRAQLEERIRAGRERLRELEATMGKGNAQAAAMAKEEADAVERTQRARNETGAGDYFNQQGQELDALRKQRELIGATKDMRTEEFEVMRAQQQLRELGITADDDIYKKVVARAREIGKEKQATEEILRIRNQIRQAQDFAADSMKSFLSDLLTGTEGLNGALKNLGKGFLSASLDALISGKGPLAGITGLASSDPNKQGGLMGLFSGGNIQALSKQLGKEVKDGAKAGVGAGVESVAGDTSAFKIFGIDGKDLAGGLTAIAGLAGAYGAGAAAGSYGQAVGGGALSGGMAGLALAGTGIGASLGGAAVLGPIGMIIGAGLAYWGQKSAREAAKKQREEEAQANYKAAEPQIATMRSQLRGEAQDTLRNRLRETESNVMKLIDVAFYASKIDEANALGTDYWNYRYKQIEDFQRAVPGLIDSMMQGLGPNSAFASARDSVKSTGDALKGFVADVEFALGPDSPYLQQAKAAALEHALSILDGAKTLSTVATRMEEIRGAGAALNQLLVELGMSATDAAAAIERDTIAAINRLRTAFDNDINSQINEAQGFGYVNDFNALLAQYDKNIADSAKIGGTANLAEWFRSQAQAIVDSEQLTGKAFENLVKGLPRFAGVITEFVEKVDEASKAADIAARRLAYQDRLFNALNDTSTLEGQLAAYDRQALRDREAEFKAGNEAIVDLEAAQMAERFNIIRDFNQKALDDQKRAVEEARSYWERFSRKIKEYLDGLRAGSGSPLSPEARLAAAQSQYNAERALAQGGNRDALDSITKYADDFLNAARDFYGSSVGFQDVFAQIQSQLGALPAQVSPEQLIVNAIDASKTATVNAIDLMKSTLQTAVSSGSAQNIATALSTYFNKIDLNTSGSIDFNEMKTALGGMASDSALRSMFTRLDTDNSGGLEKAELMRLALNGVQTNTGDTKTATDQTKTTLNDTLTGRIPTLALAQISGNTANTSVGVSQVRASVDTVYTNTNGIPTYIGQLGWLATIKDQALRIGANTLAQANRTYLNGASNPAQGAYYEGGYTGNYGTRQEAGVVHGQEYVLNAAATRRIGLGNLDFMNDNGMIPMPAAGGGRSDAIIVAKLMELTEAVRSADRKNEAGHRMTAGATLEGAKHVRDGIDESSPSDRSAARAARRERMRSRAA